MTDPWDKPFDGSIFDDSYETSKIVAAAEGMSIPEYPWNHPAVKFARWFIDEFGHGPKGSKSWIDHGADYRVAKEFPESGADDTTGVENDDSVMQQYETDTATNGGQNGGETIDEITVVDKFPENPTQGMQVIKDGIKYVWSVWGLGDGWEAIPDESPGPPADNETIEEITVTGTQPDSMWSGIDWSSILSGIGGITGLGSLLGWEGLGGGDDDGEELSWFEKLFEIVKSKKAIDDYNKYKVPTGQMAAQSAIGKQWGLPSKESMVMQGLGPNYLQEQKYAMNKGVPMPAATHVSGMPLLEEIEGGNQGGIMGLKSHGDITPAFLEPGEFVFTKKATDNIGAKRLYKLMKQAEQMGIG